MEQKEDFDTISEKTAQELCDETYIHRPQQAKTW